MILLDEPTSGMDSFKATAIVKLLNKLARRGKTVIATIHSPNSSAYSFFDRLILLMDGYLAYQGKAKDCNKYFSSIGFKFPQFGNPSDEFMKVISCNYPKTNEDEARITKIRESYNSILAADIENNMKSVNFPAIDFTRKTKPIPRLTEYSILLWRSRSFIKNEP